MDTKQTAYTGETDEEIRNKRVATIVAVYELMRQWRPLVDDTRLDKGRVRLAVEDYIVEWKMLKARDNIQERIQRHKIAGLMAAAIVRTRPLADHYRDDFDGLSSMGASQHNEKFAIYHGVAICGEGCPHEQFKALLNDAHFKTWVESFILLFRNGSPCRDSLIHIFRTLCLGFFPKNLGNNHGSGA